MKAPTISETPSFFCDEDNADNVMMNGRLQSENPKFAEFAHKRGA
jgi:hypothetical protein